MDLIIITTIQGSYHSSCSIPPFGVLFSVTRRYKSWNVCVLEIGDILFTLSYVFCVIYLFIYLFVFFDALLIILFFLMHCWSFKILGWVGRDSCPRPLYLNWSWWVAFNYCLHIDGSCCFWGPEVFRGGSPGFSYDIFLWGGGLLVPVPLGAVGLVPRLYYLAHGKHSL